jgi:hypothetical protein
MTNILRYPLRNISPETISDLQEKYPNASVQIELHDTPVAGGLSEPAFWELIDLLDWKHLGNDDAVVEPLVQALGQAPLRHIYDFKDILSQKLYLIDTVEHARQIGQRAFREDAEDFSADGFLFARCCAVANGKEQYEAIRQNPALIPKDLEFAPLLRIANEAHRRSQGTVLKYVSAYSVETFSNHKGWKGYL